LGIGIGAGIGNGVVHELYKRRNKEMINLKTIQMVMLNYLKMKKMITKELANVKLASSLTLSVSYTPKLYLYKKLCKQI
jgi:hypothetical protein